LPYRPGLDGLRALAVIVVLAFLWSQGGKYRPAYTRHHRLGLPRRGRFRRRWGWFAPTLLDLLGVAALGGLVWFCLRLGEFQPFLYRGAPSSGSRRRSRSWPSSTRARAQEARAQARASWARARVDDGHDRDRRREPDEGAPL